MKKHYHFIGIGGIGMGALASLLLDKGHSVSGSDLRENSVTKYLQQKGAVTFVGHDAHHIKNPDVIVFSSAIAQDNSEIQEAKAKDIPVISRAQLLAELMQDHIGITVVGAHGKTTTTSMVAHLLTKAGLQPTTAVGGIIEEFNSNAYLGKGEYFVAELDESDGSFLHFNPQYSIITNIDFEHIDYYHNWENILNAYRRFIYQTQKGGKLFVYGDDPRLSYLMSESKKAFVTYGFESKNNVFARNIRLDGFHTYFECVAYGKSLGEFELCVPGKHNILNALASIALSLSLSIESEDIKEAMKAYQGVRRRFQVKSMKDDIWVVDDYAHHPTEIKATLEAASCLERNRVITVFQPHRYSRVKALWKEFSNSFNQSDYVIITDIYAASEEPMEGITSEALVEHIEECTNKPVVYIERKKVTNHIKSIVKSGDIVLILGAGDITNVSDEIDIKGGSDLLLDRKNKKVSVPFYFTIGVLMGGYSSERAISLKSGQAVCQALEGLGYKVVPIDIRDQEEDKIVSQMMDADIDVAFIALHGCLGEDGKIQTILDKIGIPYTGSGVEASQTALNKITTKEVLKKNGIVVPRYIEIGKRKGDSDLFLDKENKKKVAVPFSYPYVIKPVYEGSSIGISLASSLKDFDKALRDAWQYGSVALCEEYIHGRELTVGILNQQALPVVEICPQTHFFDFTAKYSKGMTKYTVPAKISQEITQSLQRIAVKAHQVLGCEDFSRVDFILSEEGIPYVLEVNTIPGFTDTSLLPMAAKNAGLNFSELCSKLIELAYGKKKEISDKNTSCCY